MLCATDFRLREIQAGVVKLGWASSIPAMHAVAPELLVPHFHKKDLPVFATFRTEAGWNCRRRHETGCWTGSPRSMATGMRCLPLS